MSDGQPVGGMPDSWWRPALVRSTGVRTWLTNLAILAVGLINSVLLARWLDLAGRGEVAVMLLWPALIIYLASLGLIDAVLYFAALPGARLGSLLINGVLLAAGQSAVAVPLGYIAMPLLLASQRAEVVAASRLYLLVVPMSLITQYNASVLQGRLQIGMFNVLRLVIPVGYLGGTVALFTSHALTVQHIVLLHLGLNALALVGTIVALRWMGVSLAATVDLPLAKEMLRYGTRVQVGTISQMANLRLDQQLMGALMAPAELALYVTAVAATGVTQTVSLAVRLVLTPSLAQQTDGARQVAHLTTVFRRYWLLSLTITLPLSVALYWAIPLVYGARYRGAIGPAEVLLLAALCLGAKEVLGGGARALGNPWLASRAELLGLGVTVVLLAALLPTLGIMGAAIASLAAYATSLVVIVRGLDRCHAIAPGDLFRLVAGRPPSPAAPP